jgi:hypothetical protein
MNYQNKFSIYRDATRLVIEMEDAVRDFPRYHKYTLGSEMCTIAYDLLTVISYTINNKNDRKHFIKKAHQFSEVLKIKIQIAKQITMLSFKAFETLANLSNASNAWQLNFMQNCNCLLIVMLLSSHTYHLYLCYNHCHSSLECIFSTLK